MIVGAAVSFAVGGSAYRLADAEQCCVNVNAAAAPAPAGADTAAEHPGMRVVSVPPASTPAMRIVDVPRDLPVGVAPERGLQVRTILVARSVSDSFPEIHNIGGVRPDALRWHPNGLALDVMIPNPSSAEGVALGNEVMSFALNNAGRFGLQDVIWRGVYYTPDGAKRSGYGHFDHVHITTTGGGYPNGNEVYLR